MDLNQFDSSLTPSSRKWTPVPLEPEEREDGTEPEVLQMTLKCNPTVQGSQTYKLPAQIFRGGLVEEYLKWDNISRKSTWG